MNRNCDDINMLARLLSAYSQIAEADAMIKNIDGDLWMRITGLRIVKKSMRDA
jgi:hypothetical protein